MRTAGLAVNEHSAISGGTRAWKEGHAQVVERLEAVDGRVRLGEDR